MPLCVRVGLCVRVMSISGRDAVRWRDVLFSVLVVVVSVLLLLLCGFVRGASRSMRSPVPPNRKGN